MRAFVVLALFACLVGCSTLGTVASNLTKPADPAHPEGPTVADKVAEGTPLAPIVAGAGGLLASVLALLKARKVEGETDELWEKTHAVKGDKA